MNRRERYSLLALALASSMALTSTRVPADSLVTTDGDMMVGSVTKTATGYTIQTDNGPVNLPAEKVKRVLYDHPPVLPQPAASAAKAPDPRKMKSLSVLLDQGRAALSSAEYPDARDAFKDALAVDPNNAVAGRGLGFAYIVLGNTGKALGPLEIAALAGPLDRSLVLAISSALVVDHNSMRAVKFLRPWLEAHGSPVDETMLNALGIALSQADSSAAKSTLFKDSVKLYLKLNTALEATHPGKRRWGVEWEDASEVTAKETSRENAQKKVDAAWTKLQTANGQLTSAQSELKQATSTLGTRQEPKIRKAQEKVNQATQQQSTAQTEYDAASKELAAAPAAEFPKTIAVANSDLAAFSVAASSTGADSNSVAFAAPVTPDPTAPVPVPRGGNAKSPAPAQPATPDAPASVAAAQPAAAKHLTRYAVAFAIAPDVFVTAFSAVDGATTITLQDADGKSMPATILQAHQGDGLALLKVNGANFPCLMLAGAMGDGAITCLGFPDVDLFNPIAKSMGATAGPVTDSWTVHVDTPPRLPGGPLIQNGAVVGIELGDRDSDPSAVPAGTLKMLQSLAGNYARGGSLTGDPKQAVFQVMAER